MSGSPSPGSDRFPSTHWSEVRDAAGAGAGPGREALAGLLRRYLPALKVYLARKRGLRGEAADDLLQSFAAQKVLDGRFVAAADRERGRFRSFLLTALDHFVIDQARRERLGGRKVALHDPEAPEEGPAAQDVPDAFDVAWARQVIDETLRRMREQCDAGGRADLWGLFDVRVVGPTLRGEAAPAYEELVARFGFASPTQASNALVTAKRMFERTLRAVVMEYAGGGASVEGELRDLQEILSRAGARFG
jgi:DNA-directed RNA polymerase specialized sigma24 family protein